MIEHPACLYTGFLAAALVTVCVEAFRFAGRAGGSALRWRAVNIRENSPMCEC